LAEEIASSLVDWKDADHIIFNDPAGAEDEYYMSLEIPYASKDYPFENLEELLLIRGMEKEVFDAIRPYVTVFPMEGRLRVNWDTASDQVLLAVAAHLTGAQTNTTLDDAASLVGKIISFREGSDGVLGTEDDRIVDVQKMPLTSKEKVLGLKMNSMRTHQSNFLRAVIQAKEESAVFPYQVEVVLDRKKDSLVYWRRY